MTLNSPIAAMVCQARVKSSRVRRRVRRPVTSRALGPSRLDSMILAENLHFSAKICLQELSRKL
jgi:hypothetical protein